MRTGTIAFHRPARVQPAPIDPDPIGNAIWQVLAQVSRFEPRARVQRLNRGRSA